MTEHTKDRIADWAPVILCGIAALNVALAVLNFAIGSPLLGLYQLIVAALFVTLVYVLGTLRQAARDRDRYADELNGRGWVFTENVDPR